MELHGKIALIKYVRRISDVGLIDAKDIVDAFSRLYYGGDDDNVWNELDIIRLSLFLGKVRAGVWTIRDEKVVVEKVITYDDIANLTEF